MIDINDIITIELADLPFAQAQGSSLKRIRTIHSCSITRLNLSHPSPAKYAFLRLIDNKNRFRRELVRAACT